MNTSEVLNKAADLLEGRGWIKGSDGWGEGENAPLCLEGAIAAAADIPASRYSTLGIYRCDAYWAVADYLDRTPTPRVAPINDALWSWNDEQTSAEQVIETLRAAAVIEAAKETADERESVTA